jgi:hypothetical protein
MAAEYYLARTTLRTALNQTNLYPWPWVQHPGNGNCFLFKKEKGTYKVCNETWWHPLKLKLGAAEHGKTSS